LTAAVTAATWTVQPLVPRSFSDRPWGWAIPLFALAGLAGVWWWSRAAGRTREAFFASCLFLVGMLGSVAFSIYPFVLPSVTPAVHPGLTVDNAATARSGLEIGLMWWIPGMALATGYAVFVYRRFAGKVGVTG
jgi:cytochrome d ubiquinol oxidase subunit II